jgi:hypothetical protein
VQRLGVKHDFCRMIESKTDPNDAFFACALGGTDGLSSIKYRTQSTKNGFQKSRDDYMNDITGEGRQGYCRILKTSANTFEAMCNTPQDTGFSITTVNDPNPPEHIIELLNFYQGIMVWLRLRDDMADYAKNIQVHRAGGLSIREVPANPRITNGLKFNGENQYLRLTDGTDFGFGSQINLRYCRAISFWVYFEEFTNNAHIFDFGNGAGKDNVWCGILGRGSEGVSQECRKNQNTSMPQQPIVPKQSCFGPDSDSDSNFNYGTDTVPSYPSGQQCVSTTSPQEAMYTSPANVDSFECPKPEQYGKIIPPLHKKAIKKQQTAKADLVYEVWDHEQRKMHIQVPSVIELRKWCHVAICADSNDAFRPSILVYVNGQEVYREDDGHLPQTNFTSHNYIGKSNWSTTTSQYNNADELFKGSLFDFRIYETVMPSAKVTATYNWGKTFLNV